MLAHHSSISSSPSSKFCTTLDTRIFQDVAGDVTVVVDGESFLLHKFPLVTRSGKFRKMVADSKGSNISRLELINLPGGPETFKLTAKFCYGINFEITTTNVAHLRCAAQYLEMTDDYREDNLVSRSETYLNDVVIHSIEKCVEVLSACESLPSEIVEEAGVPVRCVGAIATNACKEQLSSNLARLDCNELKGSDCVEWWVEDLSTLRIDYYSRVIQAMAKGGVRDNSIVASVMHYAHIWLKGIGKLQIWNPARLGSSFGSRGCDQKAIVEALVALLPEEERSLVPLGFLFGMLRMSIMVDASVSCRLELERRLATRLEMASIDDLLIPNTQKGDSLFDVETIRRIVEIFLHWIEDEEGKECGYESRGYGSPTHGSLLKVGRLIDAYIAEIGGDPYLSMEKFIAMLEILPDYARVIDDGLYRAVDIYLKAHPMLSDDQRKKLCRVIDCQKLSQEASKHAAQNDRLPVHMTVKVLYFEHLRLKNAVSGSSGETFSSQKISSSIPSAPMSPRDTYASLRRENRELKLEISRLRMRLNDLEKDQLIMKQEMMGKSENRKTFLTSISKGIGRIGIFNGQTGKRRNKSVRKNGRNRRHSMS